MGRNCSFKDPAFADHPLAGIGQTAIAPAAAKLSWMPPCGNSANIFATPRAALTIISPQEQ